MIVEIFMYLNTTRVLKSIGYQAKDIKNSQNYDPEKQGPITPKFGKRGKTIKAINSGAGGGLLSKIDAMSLDEIIEQIQSIQRKVGVSVSKHGLINEAKQVEKYAKALSKRHNLRTSDPKPLHPGSMSSDMGNVEDSHDVDDNR